jgi:hypothetical protein
MSANVAIAATLPGGTVSSSHSHGAAWGQVAKWSHQ